MDRGITLTPFGLDVERVQTEADTLIVTAPRSPLDVTDPADARRRIDELERKIGQQQLDLDFFRAALRRVRDQRLTKAGLGETTSTR